MLLGRRPLLSLLAAGATLTTLLRARQGIAAAPGPKPSAGEAPEGLAKLEAIPPRPAPALDFTDAQEQPASLDAFRGKAVLVNFWATWCPPCVAEMPALDRAQQALGPEGWVVLALSSDRGGRAQVEAFYQRTGVRSLGVWLDPKGAAARAAGSRGLPTSLIVDRAGREVARLEGAAAWDHPAFLARLRALAEGQDTT